MSEALRCYRCGAPLAALTLPLSRLDECPECRAELHVCRMCTHYAPQLSEGCDEDDAPHVRDREAANFCDYFRPNPRAWSAADAQREAAARARLEALFGGGSGDDATRSAGFDGAGSESAGSEGAGSEGAGPGAEQDDLTEQARRAAEALFRK